MSGFAALEQKHSVAAIKSETGRMMLIDLGPATAENVPANAAPGDHVSRQRAGRHRRKLSRALCRTSVHRK